MPLNRREFLKVSGIVAGASFLEMNGGSAMGKEMSRVALVSTDNRKQGVKNAWDALKINPVKGKSVLIKPNFNTADSTPGSTHNDTLVALVEEIWARGAKAISLGERSFPLTQDVMQQKGVVPLLEKLQVGIIDFDLLKASDWVEFQPKNSHWKKGFRIARPIVESECLVSTCCLKTHQFGGVFTMSLKLHVGVVPTVRHGYEYMRELHSLPHQRKMIAEINEPFSPHLVILDGVEAFVDGGPATGKRAQANIFLASTDRVAVDAVGVATLKLLGSNAGIMNSKIFEQEQIAWAVELGLGASSSGEIEVIPADAQSQEACNRVVEMLKKG